MKQFDMDYTARGVNNIENLAYDPDIWEEPSDVIYRNLKEKCGIVGFGDYLKRCIYELADLEEPFSDVSDDTYKDIIISNFKETETPCSFEPTSTKLSAAVKNWLSQRIVSRNTVLLIGFGLCLETEQVNELLTKAIFEQEINSKDPREVICWYCYDNNFEYSKFKELWDEYNNLSGNSDETDSNFSIDSTVNIRNSMYSINCDESLFDYLRNLKNGNVSKFSHTAKREFETLYNQVRTFVAMNLKNPERVTPGGVADYIYGAGIAITSSGNLQKEKLSDLKELFKNINRLDRQRIRKILNSEIDVTRFDLITLNFIIHSHKENPYVDKQCKDFFEDTNAILERCFMEPLIVQNPYENFILTCMLTEHPLDTFNEVWENSYNHDVDD